MFFFLFYLKIFTIERLFDRKAPFFFGLIFIVLDVDIFTPFINLFRRGAVLDSSFLLRQLLYISLSNLTCAIFYFDNFSF